MLEEGERETERKGSRNEREWGECEQPLGYGKWKSMRVGSWSVLKWRVKMVFDVAKGLERGKSYKSFFFDHLGQFSLN